MPRMLRHALPATLLKLDVMELAMGSVQTHAQLYG